MEKLMKTSKIVDKVLKFVSGLIIIMGSVIAVLGVLCLILMATKSELVTTIGFNRISFGGVAFNLKETVPADKDYMMATLFMAVIIIVLVLTVYCYIIRLLRKVLNPMKEGQPFGGTVSRNLKKLGFAFMIASIITNILLSIGNHIMFVSRDVMEIIKSEMVSSITVESEINLTAIFAGILIVMLSHVFRYGEELQQQADETL